MKDIKEDAMITVHHLNKSRSHRIIWLLEELEINYQLITYERDPKTWLAPPEYKRLHPMGTSPTITDGNLVLTESGAIIEYILQKYGQGRLKPEEGSLPWVEYIYWLHFAEGTLMPMLILKLIMATVHKRSPFFIKPITNRIKQSINNKLISPRLHTQMAYIESVLVNDTWLAGDEFTAADIQMAVPLIWASRDPQLMKDKPYIQGYLERAQARPAFKRCIEKSGAFDRVA